MKAEHRHELKTNELAEWLTNFPDWAKKNLKTIIYVAIVVVLVAGSAVYHWYGKNVEQARMRTRFTTLLTDLSRLKDQIVRGQPAGVDTSGNLINLAQSFESLAREAAGDEMAALAFIQQGDALRMELLYRPASALVEQDPRSQIEQAKIAYTEALSKASKNSSLTATARLGLGLCEEELGNYERARQMYQEITGTVDFEPTVAFAQAQKRLATMDDYRQRVAFVKPAPKPPADVNAPAINLNVPVVTDSNAASAEITQPKVEPKVADSNAPNPASAPTAPNSPPSQ